MNLSLALIAIGIIVALLVSEIIGIVLVVAGVLLLVTGRG